MKIVKLKFKLTFFIYLIKKKDNNFYSTENHRHLINIDRDSDFGYHPNTEYIQIQRLLNNKNNKINYNKMDSRKTERKKPILFKGFNNHKNKTELFQHNTPLLPTIKVQKIKRVPEVGPNLFFSTRLFSTSIDNILTNSSGNFTTYFINGRILRGPLRNLLDNGDKFKDSYFQACLIPEHYPAVNKKEGPEVTENSLKNKQIMNKKEAKKQQPFVNNPPTNKNLSDYLRIRTCRSAYYK